MHFNIPKLGRGSSWSLPAHLSLNMDNRRGSGTIHSNGGETTLNQLYCLRQIEDEISFLVEPDVDFVTLFKVDHLVTIKGIVFAELDLSKYLFTIELCFYKIIKFVLKVTKTRTRL